MKQARSMAFIAAFSALALSPVIVRADTTSDIQAKINQRNTDIQALEKEIADYQNQISVLNGQASSLTSAIKALTLTEKKLQADTKVTEDKIDTTNLRIQQLSSQIGFTQDTISDNTRFVLASFRAIDESGRRTLLEILLASQSIGQAWNSAAHLGILQSDLQSHIRDLTAAKTSLETNRTATEKAKADLVKLQKQLQGQEKAVLATRAEKNSLLSQTKNSEKSYQALVSQKQALRDAFQQEISDYESQLQLVVNRANLPTTGPGTLTWPLDKIIVTQFFGDTPFSTANPQIYNGQGHGGVDFGAAIGTPVRAARSGTVIGVANTDMLAGCYSFGKWIMIKHGNGLSTLYAHLSVQLAGVGDTVSTGDVIGYSGNTGYSTGPHLHFGVYATEGTEIKLFTSSKHCQGATIPIAVLTAYLNPLSYLPLLRK